MKYKTLGLCAALCSLLSAACGDKGALNSQDQQFYEGPILIWNLSQFELLEIYSHSSWGVNNAGENQFTEPLAVDATAVIIWREGNYLSVIREKTQGGFLLGLTTHEPPMFSSQYSVLIVFDDGFRALTTESQAQDTHGFPGFPTEITEYVSSNQPYPY